MNISIFLNRIAPVASVTAILISIDALWLASLRRPVHDTYIGTVHFRAFQSALMQAGDWPWWTSFNRYGFSLSTLHLAPVFIDPLGVLLAYFTQYDIATYGLDLFTHSLLGAIGAYLLGRNFLKTSIASVAVAISFIGSGVVTTSSFAGVVHSGYMLLPWVLLAVSRAASSKSRLETVSATGLLATSVAWLIASAYPATWITLPVFTLPFTLVLSGLFSGGPFSRVARTVAACGVACLVSAAIVAPWVAETVATPIFGNAIRNNIDPNEGSLPFAGLFGLFMVNPTYTPGASQVAARPVYLGLLAGFALAWRVTGWGISTLPHIRSLFLLSGMSFLCMSATPLAFDTHFLDIFILIPSSFSFTWPRENIVTLGLAVILLATSPKMQYKWNITDVALVSTSAIVWLCALDGPVGHIIRLTFPPFIWSRWSYYYLGIAVLTDLLLAWRTIEFVARTAPSQPHHRTQYPTVVAFTLLFAIALSIMYTPTNGPILGVTNRDLEEARIGVTTISWVTMYTFSGAFLYPVLRHFTPLRQYSTTVFLFYFFTFHSLLIYTLTICVGYFLTNKESILHAYLRLPSPGQLTVDFISAISITTIATILWRFAPRSKLLVGFVAITIIDVTIAVPRYLSDTDMVIGGQPGISLNAHTTFDFAGFTRDSKLAGIEAPMLAKRPGSSPWPTLVPQVRALDASFNQASFFDQFAHFPSEWQEVSPTDVEIYPETFGRGLQIDPRTNHGARQAPECDRNLTWTDNEPIATVVDFRSSIHGLSIKSNCSRLMVSNDTWAKGWSVTIDGESSTVLKVNGTIRGVMIPTGAHYVKWTYRPAFWEFTRWIMLVGMALAAGMISLPAWIEWRHQTQQGHVDRP